MSKLVVLVLVIILVLWAATVPVLMLCEGDVAKRGQIGDAFGSINALFSGLALAGVIMAILLQREELGLQREELTETRTVLQKTLHAQTYGVVHGILQAENVRDARRKTFTVFAKDDFSNPDALSPDARNAAEIVCHTFDAAGLLVRHGLIPPEHIAYPYAHTLASCWNRLRPLVEAYRKARAAPELWTAFEELADLAVGFKARQKAGVPTA